jgi:DNA polymerase-3 subunit epsilon
MSRIFFFDTETSGMPDWKNPSDAPQQPHIVEIGALVVDADNYEVIHSLSTIIKPDGWVIDDEVAQIHGITHEKAMDVGIPEAAALAIAMDLWRCCGSRVGYNQMFDARIFRIALKRYRPDEAEAFKAAPSECCMRQAQKILGGKWPKLADAYNNVTGRILDGAHSAYADAVATAELHKALRGRIPA